MKNKSILLLGLVVILGALFYIETLRPETSTRKKLSIFAENESLPFQNGDIIFQSSVSTQCKAIQLATGSMYSHCGILFFEDNEWFVYEAVQPVSRTRFKTWIKRGEKEHYVVKRLKNSSELLSKDQQASLLANTKKYLGKNYDIAFGWSDESIYCSELVWKVYYKTLNLEVGTLKPLKEMDLSSTLVKKTMYERYGTDIPYEELTISPGSIYESDLLGVVEIKNEL